MNLCFELPKVYSKAAITFGWEPKVNC